jgi:hypothetical protein
MAALGSGVDLLGPFVDGDAILDGISRRSRPARAAAFVTARPPLKKRRLPNACPHSNIPRMDDGIAAGKCRERPAAAAGHEYRKSRQ